MSATQSKPSTPAERMALYIALRDRKEAAEAELKESLKPIVRGLEILERQLAADLDAANLQSMNSGGAVAFYQTVYNVKSLDSEKLREWVLSTEEWDAVDLRPNKTYMRELVESGEAPPECVDVQARKIVRVQRQQ